MFKIAEEDDAVKETRELMTKARFEMAKKRKTLMFYSSFLMRSPSYITRSLPTAGTDGRAYYYNPDFVRGLTKDQVVGLMVHEAEHNIFKHFARRGARDIEKFNIANDFVINSDVLKMGLKLPPNGCIDEDGKYDGMSSEQVYAQLPDDIAQKMRAKFGNPGGESGEEDMTGGVGDMWGCVFEPKNEDGSALSKSEMQKIEVQADQALIQSVQQAESSVPGSVPGHIKEMVDEMVRPKVDWRRRLRRVATQGRDPSDFSYRVPSRSVFAATGCISPTIIKDAVGKMVFFLDTSGSMSNDEFKAAVGSLNEITSDLRPELVIIIHFDTQVHKVEEFTAGNVVTKLEPTGRGGTCIRSAFEYADRKYDNIVNSVVFTDGYLSCPEKAPSFGDSLIWLTTQATGFADYGDEVKIEL